MAARLIRAGGKIPAAALADYRATLDFWLANLELEELLSQLSGQTMAGAESEALAVLSKAMAAYARLDRDWIAAHFDAIFAAAEQTPLSGERFFVLLHAGLLDRDDLADFLFINTLGELVEERAKLKRGGLATAQIAENPFHDGLFFKMGAETLRYVSESVVAKSLSYGSVRPVLSGSDERKKTATFLYKYSGDRRDIALAYEKLLPRAEAASRLVDLFFANLQLKDVAVVLDIMKHHPEIAWEPLLRVHLAMNYDGDLYKDKIDAILDVLTELGHTSEASYWRNYHAQELILVTQYYNGYHSHVISGCSASRT